MTAHTEDMLHTAICQAVGLMNRTPEQFGSEANTILRQALADYAEAVLSSQPKVPELSDEQIDTIWESLAPIAQSIIARSAPDQWTAQLRREFARAMLAAAAPKTPTPCELKEEKKE